MHLSTIRSPCSAAGFKKVDEPLQLDMSGLSLSNEFMQGNSKNPPEGHSRVRYKVMELPISLPFQKPPADKPNPKQGIGLLSWSKDSQYLFTRNDSMPTVLWIWNSRYLELATILVQKEAICAAAWDPTSPRLVLCTGSSHLYMWTPSGAYCFSISLSQFSIMDLKWNSDGSYLFLKDHESFYCAAVPMLQDSEEDKIVALTSKLFLATCIISYCPHRGFVVCILITFYNN
ncbi:hypothetical protein GIB67_031546 [Kingdonia uniflora]|uniref:WD-repeat protein n=1 Tax=Kingdonia uniflora TaxID=39325 RepID=A0A7J7PBA4_9MAGN|nr:hypothetical protein GIB67_031546 [Kingdonia uniflora]